MLRSSENEKSAFLWVFFRLIIVSGHARRFLRFPGFFSGQKGDDEIDLVVEHLCLTEKGQVDLDQVVEGARDKDIGCVSGGRGGGFHDDRGWFGE